MGQGRDHGVAILARGVQLVETRRELPGDPNDREARYIEAAVCGVLVGCLYLPNGNPQPGPKAEPLPCPGFIPCIVSNTDPESDEVEIDTKEPLGVEAVDGQTCFVVSRRLLSEIPTR